MERTQTKNPILTFVAKLLVFFFLLVVSVEFLLPSADDLREPIKRILSERNKVFLLGMVQNPAALYMASEIAEKDGFVESAKRDMELAIGLIELHSADKRAMKRYYERLEMLNEKLAASVARK